MNAPNRSAASRPAPNPSIGAIGGRFRRILGTLPTGVSAVTAMTEAGVPTGMVVGSFTSVSLDPPLVGFFPDVGSSTWPLIEAAGKFSVNILACDQGPLCRQLATKGADKFAGVSYRLSNHGVPVLAGALTVIECDLHSVMPAGDHLFVLGHVRALDILTEGDPMIFFRGRYGSFAEVKA